MFDYVVERFQSTAPLLFHAWVQFTACHESSVVVQVQLTGRHSQCAAVEHNVASAYREILKGLSIGKRHTCIMH